MDSGVLTMLNQESFNVISTIVVQGVTIQIVTQGNRFDFIVAGQPMPKVLRYEATINIVDEFTVQDITMLVLSDNNRFGFVQKGKPFPKNLLYTSKDYAGQAARKAALRYKINNSESGAVEQPLRFAYTNCSYKGVKVEITIWSDTDLQSFGFALVTACAPRRLPFSSSDTARTAAVQLAKDLISAGVRNFDALTSDNDKFSSKQP